MKLPGCTIIQTGIQQSLYINRSERTLRRSEGPFTTRTLERRKVRSLRGPPGTTQGAFTTGTPWNDARCVHYGDPLERRKVRSLRGPPGTTQGAFTMGIPWNDARCVHYGDPLERRKVRSLRGSPGTTQGAFTTGIPWNDARCVHYGLWGYWTMYRDEENRLCLLLN
jgi:hypothetical protein